jgi:hypothetical protein
MNPGMVTILANSDKDWKALTTTEGSSFIRTLSEWEAAITNRRIHGTPLSRLDADGLARFQEQLRFTEVTVNGIPVKRCCISWYYGELTEKYHFTPAEVLDVAALFGIGPERFARTADKFGDLCDGDVCCRPRIAYNCPDGNPACNC